MRKINVAGETWEFFIGKNNVVIRNPRDEKKMVLTFERITGRSPSTIERGQNKKTRDGMITPSDLKAFIVKEFPIVVEEAAE